MVATVPGGPKTSMTTATSSVQRRLSRRPIENRGIRDLFNERRQART
jgi:hypothetical protein